MSNAIAVEIIATRILESRGKKVMLDRDLAKLYGVAPKLLNQAVKRNIRRFPDDFMFRLSWEELESLRSQSVTLNTTKPEASSLIVMPPLKEYQKHILFKKARPLYRNQQQKTRRCGMPSLSQSHLRATRKILLRALL